MGRLIIDGSQVYEIDEECIRKKKEQRKNGKQNHKKTKDTAEKEEDRNK